MHGVYWLGKDDNSLDDLKLQSIFVDIVTILNSMSDYMIINVDFSKEELAERESTIDFLISTGFFQKEEWHIPKPEIKVPEQILKYVFWNKYKSFSRKWLDEADPAIYEFFKLSHMLNHNRVDEKGTTWVRWDLADGYLLLDSGAFLLAYGGACSRIGAGTLRGRYVDVVSLNPFIPMRDYEGGDDLKHEIISAVVKEIPTPSVELSWADLIPLKNDTEFQNKIRLFRIWVSKINSTNTNTRYLADEMKTAIFEYELYMKSIKAKYTKTSFEYVISGSAYLLENIAKLRFGKLAKSVFDFREQKANLTLDEMKAPGRQLSIVPAIKDRLR